MKLKTTIQQLRTDNTKQKKKLNTAMKENEQLKCGNKNLKAILNDFINILNRLQCNPNNEQTLNVARDMLQNMGKELEE
jgi:regulator of replication initiation timing